MIWYKGPNHVYYEEDGGEIPAEEAVEFYEADVGLFLFSSDHVDLLELSFLVLLLNDEFITSSTSLPTIEHETTFLLKVAKIILRKVGE